MILGDGLVRHEQREHLRFADRQLGELLHRPGVMVTVAMPVEFERQIHAVFHEIQIPLYGANGNLKLAGQRRAIRVFLVLDQVVEAHHSLPGRADINLALDFRHISPSGEFSLLFCRLRRRMSNPIPNL